MQTLKFPHFLHPKAPVLTRSQPWLRYLPALTTAAIVLGAYLATIAPSVFPMDSSEMAVGAYALGIVHSPGYSVYLMLTHLFMKLLPIGDIAYRANLFSAITTTGAAAGLTFFAQRLGVRPLFALVAGVSFGLSFYVWSVSIVAEVYALQGLFLMLMLLLLWRWRTTGSRLALWLTALIGGLTVANNPSTLLWAPGLFLIFWQTHHRPTLTRRELGTGIAFGILGLSALLYLPLRSAAHPPLHYMGFYDETATFHIIPLTNLPNLIWYLSGQQFDALFLATDTPTKLWDEIVTFGYRLWAAFFGVGLPLGFWGIWTLWRRERSLTLGLLLIIICHAAFFIQYGATDKETMFLPVFLIWGLFLGQGLHSLYTQIPSLALVAALCLPLALLNVNYTYTNVSDYESTAINAQARLHAAGPNAIYISAWGEASAMEYYQIVEGLRGDVQVVNAFFFFNHPDKLRALVDHQLAQGRPIYVSYHIPPLVGSYKFLAAKHGFQLQPLSPKEP